MSSLWDEIGEELAAENAATNVTPIRDDMPEWMNDMERYGEQDKPVEPITLIDPALWAGTEAPARRWKVKDYIPDGQATLLTGKGAAGKSLVSQLQATCIAMGLPFLGLEVAQTNALYITCEDDQDELQRRQAAICEGLGITLESLTGKLFLLSLQGELNNELATFTTDGRMSVAPRYRQIQDACARHEIGFLTLDNTAHLFTGNENDRHQVASFINLCNRLAIAIEGAVVIVGHPNKAGDSYSGSTAWENQVRSRLFMEIPANEHGEISDPDLRVMRREKVNYAQRGGELLFRWHKGTFVLPEAVPEVASEMAQTAGDARDNSLFLACLKERNRQHRAVSEQRASRTYAPKEFEKMAESKGIGRVRLEAAMDRLFRLNAIERSFLWVDRGEGKSRFGIKEVAGNSTKTGSADLPLTSDKTPEGQRKSNEIKPLTSAGMSAVENEEKPGKPTADLSADLPLTSADLSADLPLSLQERVGASPPTGGGVSLPTWDTEIVEDPPKWMDEAPPIDPFDHAPPSNDDWLENPILNPDWNSDDD